MMPWFAAHPLVVKLIWGAIQGWGSAALIDYRTFRTWKSWHDFAVYDWNVATFRWFQGAVTGTLIAAGLSLGATFLN